MLEKSPPYDSFVALAGHDVQFQIRYDDHRWYHVDCLVDGNRIINAPLGGEAFTYTRKFESGIHHVEITISDTKKKSNKADTVQPRKLYKNEGQFEWDITVIHPNELQESTFEEAKQIVENILTLLSIGIIGKKSIEIVREYYNSLPEDEQNSLQEQTKIDDFLNNE